MAEKQEVDKGMQVGDGLFVRIIRGSALKEQDINAQQMEPTKFERLVENVRQRGSLESLPYCVAPDTKILTSDLRWVPAGSIQQGDVLMGFDEMATAAKPRKWRSAEVEEINLIERPSVRLTLDDGTVLVCSEDHQWLTERDGGRVWVESKDILGKKIVRYLHPWETDRTWEAGYLAAAFDGEGHLSYRGNHGYAPTLAQIGVAQKQNPMLDVILDVLNARGYDVGHKTQATGDTCDRLYITRRQEIMRLLGTIRPPRLMSRWDPDATGSAYAIASPAVVNVEHIGTTQVVAMRTSTGTYVAEGLASHNCHQPDGVGPIAIVSGHHRARAARAAGLQEFAVLVDTNAMPMSLIRAKQIAHNELTGRPDEEILRQMIEQIDSVDDLLVSGLPEDYLPAPERSATTLDLPHAEFDWKMVTLMFLPAQLDRLDELVSSVQSQTDVVGVARQDQFVEFSKALVQYGQVMDIKNMAAVIDKLTQVALREMSDLAVDDQDDPDDD